MDQGGGAVEDQALQTLSDDIYYNSKYNYKKMCNGNIKIRLVKLGMNKKRTTKRITKKFCTIIKGN